MTKGHGRPATRRPRAAAAGGSSAHMFAVSCLVLMSWSTVASACQVPVFRYALERWRPDSYVAVVHHTRPLTPAQEALVASLAGGGRAGPPANVVVRHAGPVDPDDEGPPEITLYYPDVPGLPRQALCRLPLDAASVAAIRTSPVRQQVIDRLLEGDSAVFVFLASGDQAKDRLRREQLLQHLEALQNEIELPDGALDDPDLRGDTAVALKLSFSVVELERNDSAERVFLAMVLASEPDLAASREPMAFPVFGRGRLLYALIGPGINEHTLSEGCRFLVGPCSCQVKELNPGVDMLFSVDWDASVIRSPGPGEAPFDAFELPSLGDLSSDAMAPGPEAQAAVDPDVEAAPAVVPEASLDSAPPKRGDLPMWGVVLIAAALVLIVAGASAALVVRLARTGASP